MSPIGGHDVVEKEKGKKMFDVKTGKKVYIKEKMSKKMPHNPLKYSKEIEKLRAKPDHTRKGYKPDKGSFIDRLEAHKREAASFDNGTWKPSKKGESFINALERHKSQREFY